MLNKYVDWKAFEIKSVVVDNLKRFDHKTTNEFIYLVNPFLVSDFRRPVVEVEDRRRGPEDEDEGDDVHRHPDPEQGTPDIVTYFTQHFQSTLKMKCSWTIYLYTWQQRKNSNSRKKVCDGFLTRLLIGRRQLLFTSHAQVTRHSSHLHWLLNIWRKNAEDFEVRWTV